MGQSLVLTLLSEVGRRVFFFFPSSSLVKGGEGGVADILTRVRAGEVRVPVVICMLHNFVAPASVYMKEVFALYLRNADNNCTLLVTCCSNDASRLPHALHSDHRAAVVS